MSLDEVACELVDAAQHAETDRHRLYRTEQLRSLTGRISAAREMIDTNPADRHSLLDLSTRAAMSPFLFARVFGDLVGMPPHKYLIRVRLRRARALLDDGVSVTAACYASGFNNLSHFIRTFRAHFGLSPSEFKQRGKLK